MKTCIICTVGIPKRADRVVRNGNHAHLSCYERPDEKSVYRVATSFIDAVREAIIDTAGRFPVAYHLPAEGDDIPAVEAAKAEFDRGIVDPAALGFDPVRADAHAFARTSGSPAALAFAEAYKDKPYQYGAGHIDEGPNGDLPVEDVNHPGHEAAAPSTFPSHSPSTLSTCRICDASIYRLTATSTKWKHTKAFHPAPVEYNTAVGADGGVLTAPGAWCVGSDEMIPEPTPGVFAAALEELNEVLGEGMRRGGVTFPVVPGQELNAAGAVCVDTLTVGEPVRDDHPFQPVAIPACRTAVGEDGAGLIIEPVGKHRADKRTPSADDRAEPVLGTTDHKSRAADCHWCDESINRVGAGLMWRHAATSQGWCIPRDVIPEPKVSIAQHACARCSCVVSSSDAVSVDGSLYHRQCQEFA